jgi:hypothetical protein
MEQPTKVCGDCRQTLSLDLFSFKDKARGTLQSRCKSCVRAYAKHHYAENKDVYVEKAMRHRGASVARNKAHVEAKLSGKGCHRCDAVHRNVFYNDAKDGSQSVHDAVFGGLGLEAVDAAIGRSQVWCSPCLQAHCIGHALAARAVRATGAEYAAQTRPTNAYRRLGS